MYNSNRPRSPFYIGTGHFRHNHFKDIVWYSSIAKMVLYVQCDLWTFCGALKTAFLDLYRFSMSTCKSRDGKLSYTLLRIKLFCPILFITPSSSFSSTTCQTTWSTTSVVLMPMAETKKYQGRTDQPTVWLGSMLKTLVCHSSVWERRNSLKYCVSLFFPLHFLCSWEAWEISYSRWSTRSPNSRSTHWGGAFYCYFYDLQVFVCQKQWRDQW